MRRSMLSSLIGIVLILMVTATCKKEARFATTSTTTTATVHVSLRFTGIVHLVGTASDERLLVAPNLTTTSSTKHFPVIIASKTFPSTLTQTGTVGGNDYKWDLLPVGITLDLPALNTALPHNALLAVNLKEDGDPRTMCPDDVQPGIPPESLHWLPRLSHISKVTGTPEVVAKYMLADPSKNDVALRLPITRGLLRADELSYRIFSFNDGASSYGTQSVANFLRHHFDVVLTRTNTRDPFKFTLTGTKFSDGGSTTTTLGTFQPSGDQIEIIIANLPDRAFFNPTAHGPLGHFKEFAYLITTGLTPMTPKLLTLECAGPVGSEVECGPVRVP